MTNEIRVEGRPPYLYMRLSMDLADGMTDEELAAFLLKEARDGIAACSPTETSRDA